MYNNNASNSLSGYDSMNTPFTVNTNTNYKQTYANQNRGTPTKNNKMDAAASIAAAAAATNSKKLNSLVRGKFCTSLVRVLANGIKMQVHLLSLKGNHVSNYDLLID